MLTGTWRQAVCLQIDTNMEKRACGLDAVACYCTEDDQIQDQKNISSKLTRAIILKVDSQ